ncbi:hypothetical protein CSC82_03775 [Rhodobacteraceae bacterium 4F10]|nr:hypothetical protein CSC82_03775 [Rhodobacteraceae bacterium 4F10]
MLKDVQNAASWKYGFMGLNNLISFRSLLIGVVSIFCCQASAEPVAVRGAERGQGYIFSHDGHCYLVTAKHVSGNRARAQVIAEGALSGSASLRFPFWDGMDVAVGVVRRGAAERCEGSIDDFAASANALGGSTQAFLALINDEGFVDRLPMSVTESRYLDFDAQFSGSRDEVEVRQGMSGGFLFGDGKPIGMAIETLDGKEIRFIRSEEIFLNVSRWIGTQSNIRMTSVSGASEAQDGLPLMVASTNAPAIGAEFLPENILSEGEAFVFSPTRNAEIVLEVAKEEKATLSRVVLNSKPESGQAVPRRVIIFASPDVEGANWRTFWSGEMSRDGVLDTGPRAQTWARRVKIVIASVWSEGPINLDRVSAM